VLNTVLDKVRAQNSGKVRFVRLISGRWYAISEDQAREKVGHCLREVVVALEGAEERLLEQKQLDVKHRHLLEQQRAIFNSLVAPSFNKKKSA